MNESEVSYVVLIIAGLSGLAAMTFAYYQTTIEHWFIAGSSGALLMGILINSINLLQERV